ncbi:MAG: hypothetical protein BWY09_01723 [Candidatus Hydrogenedentes bacterium ADurb.Bin179]|nr:MAG: hypothetical protein BWY09_01723 [Candidatus Hydrogenedentes bacterium ADurb.Bin179]
MGGNDRPNLLFAREFRWSGTVPHFFSVLCTTSAKKIGTAIGAIED